ncbi:MAG TPA: hypothetical protein PK530_01785 [Anaerolineales bacterium]|nr:hypothetical protein [Anaerolineales bacterium]
MINNFQNPITDLNRLIAAAVIDREFCALLLTNPLRAIGEGYYGEYFQFSPEAKARIGTIEASSLSEFAQKLVESPVSPENSNHIKRNGSKKHSFSYGSYYDISV